MDKDLPNMGVPEGTDMGKLKSYLIGFILSLILTLFSFFLVETRPITGWTLMITISCLALTQAFVQMIFFLHLGSEEHPRWNLMSFLFMVLIAIIIVFGSLWIMYHLNYRTMS